MKKERCHSTEIPIGSAGYYEADARRQVGTPGEEKNAFEGVLEWSDPFIGPSTVFGPSRVQTAAVICHSAPDSWFHDFS